MKFGLIGYPLVHSFSSIYFTDKFHSLGLTDFSYDNFPVPNENEIQKVLHRDIFGLNVTIPYKSSIIRYLNQIDQKAWQIGAVNTLVRTGQHSWKGYNTDEFGFRISLSKWIGNDRLPDKALVLGSGGASRAICFALQQLGVQPSVVSRNPGFDYQYDELTPELMERHLLIINATPLGMEPDQHTRPPIPYEYMTSDHWLYDLVYNPANTLFLARGLERGASIKNGLEMLYLQAEQAWTIWKMYGKF